MPRSSSSPRYRAHDRSGSSSMILMLMPSRHGALASSNSRWHCAEAMLVASLQVTFVACAHQSGRIAFGALIHSSATRSVRRIAEYRQAWRRLLLSVLT